MSKAIMLSIQPKWCELIASGEKTIEVRRTRPSIKTPFKCYIYCIKDGARYGQLSTYKPPKNPLFNKDKYLLNGKVIGEFVCDKIDRIPFDDIKDAYNDDFCGWNDFDLDRACLHQDDLYEYAKGEPLYGWHVSDLVIYDKPREIWEFKREIGRDEHVIAFAKLTRPFQSWGYVEEV